MPLPAQAEDGAALLRGPRNASITVTRHYFLSRYLSLQTSNLFLFLIYSPGGSLLHAQGPAQDVAIPRDDAQHQATEDEALRAAVAEARQGGGSSANLFFLIYSAGQRACGCATARATGVGDAPPIP